MNPGVDTAAPNAIAPGERARPALIFKTVLGVNLLAIVAVGVVFRVARLGNVPGLNADEYFCLASFGSIAAGHASHGFFVPTGRILDVFYAVPVYLLDLLVPRSPATIRLGAVFSGLLMGALAFPLLRRVRSTFVASIVTVLAIIMPVQISYSRIGWEYSQVPLAALLIVAACLDRRIWLSGLALAGGMMVHPALAYLAPMVVLSVGSKLFARMKKRDARSVALLFGVPALVLALFGVMLAVTMRSLVNDAQGMLSGVPALLQDTTKMYAFIELYSNLFGTGVSRQNLTDNPQIVFDIYNAAFLALNAFLYGAYFFTFPTRRKSNPNALGDLFIVIGLLLALVAFYLTRGPFSITPPYERYALFLIMPSLIVLAMMAESLADTGARRGIVMAGVCVAAWLIVYNFKVGYFDYFETTGGDNAHLTYRSNSIDPKVAALGWVRARGAAPVIYMKEWRTYWPVEYVASPDPTVQVRLLPQSQWSNGLSPEEFASYLAAQGTEFTASLRSTHGYVMGYPDGNFEHSLQAALPGTPVARKDFTDTGGMPIVSVWYVGG